MSGRGAACLAIAALACGDDLAAPRDAGPCRADECAPYACGPADSCLTSCDSADQCAADHVCEQRACVGTECTAGTALEVCGPYACVNGDCAADCAIGPCADGYYCRGNDNQCVPHCSEPEDPLCEGYLCNVEVGECEQICGDGLGCAAGHDCDDNGHCQPR